MNLSRGAFLKYPEQIDRVPPHQRNDKVDRLSLGQPLLGSELAQRLGRSLPGDRAWHKTQSIRRKLGGSTSLLDPLPDKPKGMRRRAHCRLLQEAHRAEMIHDAAMDAQMDRITRDFTFFGKITSRIITRQEVA